MFDLTKLTDILILIVPSLTSIIAIASGVISFGRSIKKSKEDTTRQLVEKTSKMEKSFDDIAMLKTKLSSIEKYLVDKEKKK